MLIDMHAHTSGISRCCRADARSILLAARDAGIDGLVLSNHYQEIYITSAQTTPAAFAQAYVDEYYETLRIADELGMRLFFGVEITALLHDNAHVMLYGLQPDFVLRYPDIYAEPLSVIRDRVHAEGGLVVHGHPFRKGGQLLDVTLLDGIEVNCHPKYDATHCDRILRIADEAGVMVTCGGDYHADTPYRPVCGVRFPDDLRDNAGLVGYLKHTDEITLHVHELRETQHRDVIFRKRR